MAGSAAFSAARKEPFANHPDLNLKNDRVSGPFSWLNPTRARFGYDAPRPGSAEQQTSSPIASGIDFKWRSRDNRKGRHAIVVDPDLKTSAGDVDIPEPTTGLKAVAKGIGRMFTTFPYWDVSFLAAFFFTWGSVVFVINGFFVYLPLVAPSLTFSTEEVYGGGITAFIGTVIFQFGAVFIILEAVNENQTGCFGWALEELVSDKESHVASRDGKGPRLRLTPEHHACTHHHKNKTALLSPNKGSRSHPTEDTDKDGVVGGRNDRKFVWVPTWQELKTHYFHELGFMASSILFISATIFWIIGFTGLPGVFNHLSTNLAYGVYWAPDLVGSIGFIISSAMFMLETQKNWYTPSLHVLGWHIGFWNTVGSVGFAISASMGYCYSNSGCAYQSALSTTWGSVAFLIGSAIQWYESLDKYPVEHNKKDH